MPLRVALVGIIAYALAYTATAIVPMPLPAMDAQAGTWRWAARTSPMEMRYFGQVGAACVIGLLTALPLHRLWRHRAAAPSGPADRLLAGWAAVAVGLSMTYYAWHNWP